MRRGGCVRSVSLTGAKRWRGLGLKQGGNWARTLHSPAFDGGFNWEADPRTTSAWGEVMDFIWMILIGLVAGAIAKFIMPGRDPGGIIVTILLGIAGSVVGGMLFGGSDNRVGLIGSVVGALILLLLYRLLVGRRRTNI
jgi:uncharacterized membrane protein YeaQ/YmgE (transglycosylase-associated protein family)